MSRFTTSWTLPLAPLLFDREQQGWFRSVTHFRRTCIDAAVAAGFEYVDVSRAGAADWLMCDITPECAELITRRTEKQRLFILSGGAMPRGAEPLTTDWFRNLLQDDVLMVFCRADELLARRLLGGPGGIRIVRAPMPVSAPWARTDDPSAAATGNALRLIYHGRINRQKNVHLLPVVMATIVELGWDPTLTIIGDLDDVPHDEFGVSNDGYGQQCRAAVDRAGMVDRIRWLPALDGDRLRSAVREAHISINLSTYNRENYGLSIAEAAASGLGLVTTDWGGLRDTAARVDAVGLPTKLDADGPRVTIDPVTVGCAIEAALRPALIPPTTFTAGDLESIRAVVRAEMTRSSSTPAKPVYGGEPGLRDRIKARARAAATGRCSPRSVSLDPELYVDLLSPYASEAAGC